MAGLLDFLETPAGMGLLSAIAGGMSGARRGQPVNSIGRGLVTGLQGYAGAQDQLRQADENSLTKQFKQLQMEQMQRQLEQQKTQQQWQAGLPGIMNKTTEGQVPFHVDNPFGEDIGAGLTQAGQVPDEQALQKYAMQPGSPYADELMKQRLMPQNNVEKPQLVTVYGADGRPMQKWLRPGEAEGVAIGGGKPESGNNTKLDTIDIPRKDGSWQMFQTNRDGTPNMQAPIGSPFRKRATASETTASIGFPKETFKNERDLRNDFQGLPTSKAFREVQTSYDQIKFALKNPSAANDLAAATKFMKLLDPGSVVRESELGMAMAATGKLDSMSNYYNMLKTGQKLTPSQRIDFYKSANGLYLAATERYNQNADEYRNMSKEYGLEPDRIAKRAAAEKDQEKEQKQIKFLGFE